jgi:hypothetical protein
MVSVTIDLLGVTDNVNVDDCECAESAHQTHAIHRRKTSVLTSMHCEVHSPSRAAQGKWWRSATGSEQRLRHHSAQFSSTNDL